jgi:Rieske Fe-S protein
MSDTTRRAVLAGGAGIGAAAALAACGNSGSGGGGTATNTSTPATTGTTGGGGAKGLAATVDIPIGGGKIFPADKVVITQPTAGNFKAFTAICTHMQCTVSTIKDGKINCPCHGSAYTIEDGSVAKGPATQPLASKTVKVDGDQLVVS